MALNESRIWRIFAWARAGLLLLCGLAGVVISLGHVLGHAVFEGLKPNDLEHLLLGILGLLALTFGLEHAIEFESWSRQLQSIDTRLKHAHEDVRDLILKLGGGVPLLGEEEIYENIEKLVGKAESRIRALTIGRSPKVPEAWSKAMVSKLRDSRQVTFTSIYACDFQALPENFIIEIKNRQEQHANAGVDGRATMLFVDDKAGIGFDVLIVDSKHVVIGIFGPTHREYLAGIQFVDRESVAQHFATWFDEMLSRKARTYEQFEKESGVGPIAVVARVLQKSAEEARIDKPN